MLVLSPIGCTALGLGGLPGDPDGQETAETAKSEGRYDLDEARDLEADVDEAGKVASSLSDGLAAAAVQLQVAGLRGYPAGGPCVGVLRW